MKYWSHPECVTRTGASHLRRGVVCQDASGSQVLTDRSGQPIQVLVVADGHGGQRYTHSEVGSRLACELALKLLADQFSQWSSTKDVEIQRWRSWLVETFPNSLHQRWLASVERHWRQKITEKDALEQPFSPIAYGTTLGVVIMTPTWWGHTGLGDWDLVRVRSGGDVALVNEETDESQTSGEATYSLCLSNAASHFAVRSAVYPISQDTPSFALLLSTDGVRKSCSTDDDFFAIAKYLCEGDRPRAGETANEVKSDLDRISSQGSGDDVSVAIGRWISNGQTKSKRAAPRRDKGSKRRGPIIIQPRDINPNRGLRSSDPGSYALRSKKAAETIESKRRGNRSKPLLLIISFLIIASNVGVIIFNRLQQGKINGIGKGGESLEVKPNPMISGQIDLQKKADALCDPNQWTTMSGEDNIKLYNIISATLNQRRSVFQGIINGTDPEVYLNKYRQDPLGGLIALNYLEQNEYQMNVSSLMLCPQLTTALADHWLRAKDKQQMSTAEHRDKRDNAMRSINELYHALSIKDFEIARLHYSEEIEDQFQPVFFKKFKAVTISNLEIITEHRGELIVEGEVTLNWRDGTKQVEKRLFTLDTNQANSIIRSEFVEVIEPRRDIKSGATLNSNN